MGNFNLGEMNRGQLMPAVQALIMNPATGLPVSASSPLPIASLGAITVTQTVVTLTAGDSEQLVAANASRRYLALLNIGTGLVTLGFSEAAVVGEGLPLSASDVSGDLGAGVIWEASSIPVNAIHGISAAGSTVVVLEG